MPKASLGLRYQGSNLRNKDRLIVNATLHESSETAMYRPRISSGAKPATSDCWNGKTNRVEQRAGRHHQHGPVFFEPARHPKLEENDKDGVDAKQPAIS